MKINPKALDQLMKKMPETSQKAEVKPNSKNSAIPPSVVRPEVKDRVTIKGSGGLEAELEAHREMIKARLANGYYSGRINGGRGSEQHSISEQDKKELEIAQRVLSNFEAPKGFAPKEEGSSQKPNGQKRIS